ncbi:MAG: L-threonylcarbamoyladenylate synthase [Actinomycetota bacterium]|nr:L-threonylcarbamoyladenylate synthase [Actinomycetota bacterium]
MGQKRVKVVSFTQVSKVARKAAAVLKKGGILVVPTETVYGLAADGSNPAAIEKIYQVKGRHFDKPLTVAIFERGLLKDLVSEIPPYAAALMDRFWPGPLTLIFPKGEAVQSTITRGLKGVGIRFPGDDLLLAVMKEFGAPIALTSANVSGDPSPISADEASQIEDRVDLIIDAGRTRLGRESTVLDITVSPPRILREGAIPVDQLKDFIDP